MLISSVDTIRLHTRNEGKCARCAQIWAILPSTIDTIMGNCCELLCKFMRFMLSHTVTSCFKGL